VSAARTPARARTVRHHEPALLLRRFPYGESSLVVHALTPGAGRVALLAKGAYRPSSGFYGVLDLFDTLHITWNARTGQELGVVTGASLEQRRGALAADLDRYRSALGFLELARLASREAHEERDLFRWLSDSLDLLVRGVSPGLVEAARDLALLRTEGLAPALGHCASCGTRALPSRPARVPFSTALGGRLCTPCAAEAAGRGRRVETWPLNEIKVAESLMGATPAMLDRMRLRNDLEASVRRLASRLLEHHLETRPRSRRAPGASAPR
jgi:DNA repair protein RecO